MEKKPLHPLPPMPPKAPHMPPMPPEAPYMPPGAPEIPGQYPMPENPGMMPCLPCDPHTIEQMYHHMKMCHRYELAMLKWYMRWCAKHHDRMYLPRRPWPSSCRKESSCRRDFYKKESCRMESSCRRESSSRRGWMGSSSCMMY